MAKGIYVGVGGVPKKVKKIYAGVNGVPRKVKKVFVGVNGVPRLVWSSDVTFTKIASSVQTRHDVAPAVTTATQLVFVSNAQYGKAGLSFECFNSGLGKTIVEYNDSVLNNMVSACLNNRYVFAMYGMGRDSEGDTYYSVSGVVFDSVTMTTGNRLYGSEVCGVGVKGGRCGNYVVFAGGEKRKWAYNDAVEAYDSSLVKSLPTTLNKPRIVGGAVELGNQIIFAGGSDYTYGYNNVESFNSQLIKSVAPTGLSDNKVNLMGVTAGGYALFAGGRTKIDLYNQGRSSIVDVYDASLVKVATLGIVANLSGSAGVSVDDCAIIAGGGYGEYEYSTDIVQKFDSSLQLSTIENLTLPKSGFSGGVIGNYLVLGAGGRSYPSGSNSIISTNVPEIDVYALS